MAKMKISKFIVYILMTPVVCLLLFKLLFFLAGLAHPGNDPAILILSLITSAITVLVMTVSTADCEGGMESWGYFELKLKEIFKSVEK